MTIVAMWSGPRNLSTAMMRSFGNRPDCAAMDEPFYAAYLAATGLDHPMREAVLAEGETDPSAVVRQCLEMPRPPHTLVYQKHMTHHMIDGFDTSWMDQVTNVFLIRDPARVLASYANKKQDVSADDIGFARQHDLFREVIARTGRVPPVIDADQVRRDPRGTLAALCDAIGIGFDEAMLSWTPGKRPEDGVWGEHWYDAIWKSTGFEPPDERPLPEFTGSLADIEQEARVHYDAMREALLQAGTGSPTG